MLAERGKVLDVLLASGEAAENATCPNSTSVGDSS